MSQSSRENDDVRGVDGPAARPGPDPVPAVPPSAHQAVTFLELFFDLVWVFAISQLSEHLLDHRTWRGAGETLVKCKTEIKIIFLIKYRKKNITKIC